MSFLVYFNTQMSSVAEAKTSQSDGGKCFVAKRLAFNKLNSCSCLGLVGSYPGKNTASVNSVNVVSIFSCTPSLANTNCYITLNSFSHADTIC
jgi:hypothetical protein